MVSEDEQPGKGDLDRIPTLKAAFRDGGTVTAANSSSISDGAAALVLMRRSEAERRHLKPLASIAGHASFAHEPALFPTAPVGALERLSQRTGWALDEVDLFEINEAFAMVALAAMRSLGLPHERVNIHGGACALGHPIGASGRAHPGHVCSVRSRTARPAARHGGACVSAAAKRRPMALERLD